MTFPTTQSSWQPGISAEITTSDGARLHYAVYGTGPREVLMLHGLAPSEMWRHTLAHFDLTAFRVVTCDFRGYGQSRGDPATFTYPQLHTDLLAIARAAGLHDFVVVGFSGSCRNAAWMAEGNAHVRGLVLVAPNGFGVVDLPREALAGCLEFLERNKAFPPEFNAWFSEKMGASRDSLTRSLADTPRAVLAASTALWLYTPVEEKAKRLTQPTLVVAAKREPLYDLDFQQATTVAALPRAKFAVLDCAHYVPYEEPEALAELITRFCLGLPAAPRNR